MLHEMIKLLNARFAYSHTLIYGQRPKIKWQCCDMKLLLSKWRCRLQLYHQITSVLIKLDSNIISSLFAITFMKLKHPKKNKIKMRNEIIDFSHRKSSPHTSHNSPSSPSLNVMIFTLGYSAHPTRRSAKRRE